MTLLGGHHRNSEQQHEIREARRLFKERIRDDWEYPTLPAYQRRGKPSRQSLETRGNTESEGGGAEDRIAGFRFHNPGHHDEPTSAFASLGFRPLEWRERECSSESAAESESEDRVLVVTGKHGKSEYKFDGPDSVGAQILDRRQARKRKRQQALQEEMGWNEGLAHWAGRRDAWCRAHTAAQVAMLESAPRNRGQEAASSSAGTTSLPSTPRTSTSSATTATSDPSSPSHSSPRPAPTSSSASTTPESSSTPHQQAPAPTTAAASTSPSILIPVTPPVLPTHPIRRRITPSTHTEIYTKIILQGRTPSVPINLVTLIAALVKGWKDDGEWPPKASGPLEPSIAGRRRKTGAGAGEGSGGLRNGVKAVGRVLRLTGVVDGSASGSGAGNLRRREKG